MMLKRFFAVLFTLILALVSLLIAAGIDTGGSHTVSYDEPAVLWLTMGFVVILFLPILVLSLFGNFVVRMISAVFQVFVVLSFFTMFLIGFVLPNGFLIIGISLFGFVVSILSMIITLRVGSKRADMATELSS